MPEKLIKLDKSVIVACDMDGNPTCGRLVRSLEGVAGIGGYKLGMLAGLDGLAGQVSQIRHVDKNEVIIFDYQKAGNDIPDMGPKFAKTVKEAGCDAAILFPFAGPATQTKWTESCQDAGLRVLVGGVMTHGKFLVSEGGYIADDAPERIFTLACKQGVRDFVVPGTKIEWVRKLKVLLEDRLAGGFVLYAPGFVTQGGDITEAGKAAGPYFHAIVGSAIYGQPTDEARRAAAVEATSKLGL